VPAPLARGLAATAAATAVGLVGNALAVRVIEASGARRWRRTNHAGRPVTLLEGPVAVAALLAGSAVEARRGAARAPTLAVAVAGFGSGVVGAYDDLRGSTEAKGFRGHLAALRRGTVTSGLLKIVGVGVSATAASLLLAGARGGGRTAVLDVGLDAALVAGTANLVNLFDLRSGRAVKVVLLLGAPLVGRGAGPALGAAAGSLPADLGERAMLGDCGANALGAAVATAAAARLTRTGRLAALAGVVALNLASERVSFTAVIARTPAMAWLDGLGRAQPASGPSAASGPG
jgi:UDP-N-acetylmuramyl pentapeptide phosphotransferase/UDP-N-acetylglucosamine-1-phosphate transferase